MATATPSERIPNRSRSQPSSTYIAPRSQGSSPVPNPNLATLPPLNTTQPTRRPSSQRLPSATTRRISTLSNTSAQRSRSRSRPQSIIPQFPSSLTYALVRDFAYPPQHPMHYGPPAQSSAITTPGAEPQRRLSDTSSMTFASSGGAFPGGSTYTGSDDARLPATTYAEGPPWPEDEDLHSPIVNSAKKHRHFRSDFKLDPEGDHDGQKSDSGDEDDNDDNDSGDVTPNGRHALHKSRRQQSQHPTQSSYFGPGAVADSPKPTDDQQDSRYSRDYSFTIASPDEEMHGKAVALYDFAKENENELPLVEGQVLWVSYRHIEGWLVARDPKSDENGLVPEAYVRLLRDIEGGLGGLNGLDAAIGAEPEFSPPEDPDSDTPVQADPPVPPEAPNHDSRRPSTAVKHGPYTPVVSHFSTSSHDLQPYPSGRLLSVSSQSGVSSPQSASRRISEDSRIAEQDEPDDETSEEESTAEPRESPVPVPKGSMKR
ncbi:MAG: HOG (high osmolarity glycerol) pathway protein [Chrysothrix sp. TS-e1954]|nr:MAG: HOG (high osmolarity glycerol) pathway protein [Chrysothrix sp. TS-e1954]